MADSHAVRLRRRYATDVKNAVLARKGVRRLRIIACCLIRELRGKLSAEEAATQGNNFNLYERVLNQKTKDCNKLYSLHGQRQGTQKV